MSSGSLAFTLCFVLAAVQLVLPPDINLSPVHRHMGRMFWKVLIQILKGEGCDPRLCRGRKGRTQTNIYREPSVCHALWKVRHIILSQLFEYLNNSHFPDFSSDISSSESLAWPPSLKSPSSTTVSLIRSASPLHWNLWFSCLKTRSL